MYVPHLLYLVICQWTFRLLSFLGYFKLCCKEHWGGYFLSDHVFLQIYTQEWDCSIIRYPLQYSCLENPMDGGAW